MVESKDNSPDNTTATIAAGIATTSTNVVPTTANSNNDSAVLSQTIHAPNKGKHSSTSQEKIPTGSHFRHVPDAKLDTAGKPAAKAKQLAFQTNGINKAHSMPAMSAGGSSNHKHHGGLPTEDAYQKSSVASTGNLAQWDSHTESKDLGLDGLTLVDEGVCSSHNPSEYTKDAYMFRSLGKKLRKHIRKLGETVHYQSFFRSRETSSAVFLDNYTEEDGSQAGSLDTRQTGSIDSNPTNSNTVMDPPTAANTAATTLNTPTTAVIDSPTSSSNPALNMTDQALATTKSDPSAKHSNGKQAYPKSTNSKQRQGPKSVALAARNVNVDTDTSANGRGAVEDFELAHVPIEQYCEMTRFVWSTFRIPFYAMGLDQQSRHAIPVILSLIKVAIIDSDDNLGTNYSPNTSFTIDLQYGSTLRWRITRRILDFVWLHSILSIRHLQGHIDAKLPSFPGQLSYLVDMSALKRGTREHRIDFKQKLVHERRIALERYLASLLFTMNMQVSATELFEFLELSKMSLSFAPDGPENEWKGKEGYLKNRVFDTTPPSGLLGRILRLCFPLRQKYKTQWFMVRSSFIAYVDFIDQTGPSEVLLCDRHFRIIVTNEGSKNLLKPFTLTILNGSKKLEVRAESNSQMTFWLRDLRSLAENSIWCRDHRFGSFSPVRRFSRIEWLIDGEQFYSSLVYELLKAKEEIYIHGWWVSPELYLVRPAMAHPNLRLDRLLQRKAREGVKIYIVVFKEVSMALAINSYHTKQSLEKLHPNIRVQRHPDHLGGVLLWAHHEKIVVIDQQVAFIGGLDLCYGRYDTSLHPLTDYCNPPTTTSGAEPITKPPTDPFIHQSATIEAHNLTKHPLAITNITAATTTIPDYNNLGVIWSGLDYANPRIKDFKNVAQFDAAPMVDRRSVPRMPWHDVHCALYGAPARDVARHFIQRWNFVKQQKAMHKESHIPFLLPKPDYPLPTCPEDSLERGGSQNLSSQTIQLVRSVAEWSIGTAPEVSIYDAYLTYIENSRHFIYIENQFFISRSDDQQVTPVRNRIASAIIDRILRAVENGETFRVIVFLPLLPAFESPVHRAEASSVRMIMQGQYSAISKGPHSILGQLSSRGIPIDQYISFFSLRRWDRMEGQPVTEQLYIHSKLLIVDDRVAILGSANINDRSMLGVRDSELAVIVEDEKEDLIQSTMNGKPVLVSAKILELRQRLFQEHLGLLHLPASDARVQAIKDPIIDSFYYGVLRHQASLNTQIYRELFHCVPDDCVDNWEEYRRFTEKPRVYLINPDLGIDSTDNLQHIKGNIVLFPTQFLRKEDLAASMLTPEFLLPIEVYL